MAQYKNTKPLRVYPDDIEWLNEISIERVKKGKDMKQQTPARVLKGIRNACKLSPDFEKLLKEARFK